MEPRKHLDWCGATRLGIRALKVRQNQPKTTIFMFLHQTQATRIFLSTLTKFDLRLTLGGTKNPNFDPSIRTGWSQHHYKYYGIPFLTTIHRSKSKLKWLRYLENHVEHISTIPESVTFNPTFKISTSLVFWKLEIQIFSGSPRLAKSEFRKTSKYAIKVRIEKSQSG